MLDESEERWRKAKEYIKDNKKENVDLNDSIKGAINYLDGKEKYEEDLKYQYPPQYYSFPTGYTLTGIEIGFVDLVLFLVKLAIASIPAGLIILFVYGILVFMAGMIGLGAMLSF